MTHRTPASLSENCAGMPYNHVALMTRRRATRRRGEAERRELTRHPCPKAASADRRRFKSTLRRKVLLVCVSLAIGLVCSEIIVRVFYPDLADTRFLMLMQQIGSIADIKKPSPDPVLGFELKRNLNITTHGARIITDAQGHRVPKDMTSVPKDAMRIAVLGDSSSFGWGVDYECSYPYLYRQEMARLTQAPIDMANFSVPAYDSRQEARTFQTKVLPYKPDLLILHHDDNDASPPLGLWWRDGLHPTYGDNFLHSALLKFLIRLGPSRRNVKRTDIQLPYDKAAHEFIGRGGYIASGPIYDEHLQALRELGTKARELNIPVIAVLFDAYVEFDPHFESSPEYVRLHKRLAGFLGGMGVYVLDLYPAYQRKMREMKWSDLSAWWVRKDKPEDPHPNADGHRFITDQLVEFTRANPALMVVFRGKTGRISATLSSRGSGAE
jgi:hypothetical protein